MSKVTFGGKPEFTGKFRQREILIASGHELEVRNLLTTAWTARLLSLFFDDRPVVHWFNPSNPLVKSGKILPAELSAEEALEMMVDEPLLIVRLLMQVSAQRLAGFDVQKCITGSGLTSVMLVSAIRRIAPVLSARREARPVCSD